MVRNNDDTATEARTIEGPEDVEVGDTVDISGRYFLPKSNLEVVEVDPEWADDERYEDARVFTARIPNRSNARDYSFKVSAYGIVVTTNSSGYFDNYALESKKIVDADEDDTDEDDTDEDDDRFALTDEDRERFDDEFDADDTTDDGDDYGLGDRVFVDYPDRRGIDFGVIVREKGPSGMSGDTVYVVDYDHRDGDAHVTHHKLGTVDYEAGAYTVTYERDGVVETADLAGSAIVETFEAIDDVDVIDVTCHANDDPRSSGVPSKCAECGHEGDDVELVTETHEYDEVVSRGRRHRQTGEYMNVETRRRVEGYDIPKCASCRGDTSTDGGVALTDGGTDYADTKDDDLDVVREALRDADPRALRRAFDDVTDRARDADDVVRVDVTVSPAFVARKGLTHGFGRFRFDDPPRAIPGDGGERVTFHVHPEDDASSVRNRVLQALTPFDPAHR